MSKRSFLRKSALGMAAAAGVCLTADGALAQIVLNGGTHNAHGALTDGGLNARYWHQNLLSVFTGPVANPPQNPANFNNFEPFRSFDAATQFLNGVDGNGINNPLDFNFAVPILQQDLDFPAGAGNDGTAGNPFTGVAVVDPDHHMGAWSGVFNATEAGTHTFWTASDDASMLFVDGQIVVNNNAQQGVTERSGTINLTPGNHEILIVFQETGGGSGMTANWQSPTGTRAFINPAATPSNFKYYTEPASGQGESVTVNANSTIDVLASKATFGNLELNGSVLSLTGTRLADTTTFGPTTATGNSGINNTVDASLASLNAGATPLNTFVKSGPGGLRIDGSSTLFSSTGVQIQAGTLAINATGGQQGLGSATINIQNGATLGISNADPLPATLNNAIQVSGNAGINVGAGGMGPTFGGVNLGSVIFTPDATLTKTGANGVNLSIATTSVPGGGAITYNVADGALSTAAYNSGGGALTVNKTGAGQLNLTQVGTNLVGGSFNVQAGTLSATNNAVGTSLGNTPVTLSGGRLLLNTVGSPTGFVEGLTVGYIPNNFNETTPNPGTAPNGFGGIRLDVIHGNNINTPPWVGDQETWVYTGQIFTDDGTFSFAEHIDDNVLIRIDGANVLRDTAWNVPSFTAVSTSPGWHDFEVRFGEGGGGQGPAARPGGAPSPGWNADFGFGYSPDLEPDANGANYILPIEPAGGGETLFRTQQFSGASYAGSPITVTANSSLDIAGNAANIQLGNIAMQNGANLTVNGSRPTTVPQVSVAAGTTSAITANVTGQTPLSIQNVQVPTAQLNINGTADVTGTVTGGKLGALNVGTVNVKPTASFAGAAGIETVLGGTMRFDAGTGTINAAAVSGNQTNNGALRFISGTTNLANAMLTSVPPPPGAPPVAYYSFDEGAGTTANDTGVAPNNVGTLGTGSGGTGNGPDWTTDPADRKFGTSSLRFDATGSQRDLVVIQDEASLNPVNAISFSAWIKATDWNGNRRVLQKSQGNSDTQYRFLAENGQFHFRLEAGPAPPGSITAPLPTTGQFVHVVGLFDGTAMRLFYDGVQVASRAANGQLNVTTGTLRLGTKEESVVVDGDYFNGILDEIYIFNRGLNAKEILSLRDFNTWVSASNIGTGLVDAAAGTTVNLGGFRGHESANVAGRLNLTPNGTDAGTSSVDTLNINGAGILDLANNDLIVFSTAAGKNAEHAAVQARIVSAQNGLDANLVTKWDGPGLTSSTARANNVAQGFDLTGLGVIRNSDLDVTTGIPGSGYTTFSGQAVTPDDVLVKYTYIGDANLSGAVSFDDYVGMDNAFFGLIPNLGWATGDINFDGVINFDDYSKVDQAFFFQGAPLSGEAGVAAVPEPGTWLLAALGCLAGLFTCWRRKK